MFTLILHVFLATQAGGLAEVGTITRADTQFATLEKCQEAIQGDMLDAEKVVADRFTGAVTKIKAECVAGDPKEERGA